jgi:hypothetical protein
LTWCPKAKHGSGAAERGVHDVSEHRVRSWSGPESLFDGHGCRGGVNLGPGLGLHYLAETGLVEDDRAEFAG